MHKQVFYTAIAILLSVFTLQFCKKNNQSQPPLPPVQTIRFVDTAQLKEERAYAAAAAVGDKIYIFGGTSRGNTIEVFDTKTNTSTKLNDTLKETKYWVTASAVRDKIYIFSIHAISLLNDEYKNTIEVFDTKTQTISVLNDTLKEQITFGGCSTAVGDKIYIFGGQINNGMSTDTFSKTVEVFDTKTEKVSLLSQALPKRKAYMSAAAVNDKAYIFGGYQYDNDIEAFDTKSQTTYILDDSFSISKWGTSAVAIEDKIFVFGGHNSTGVGNLSTIEMLNTKINTLYTLSARLRQEKYGTCSAVVGNKIYIFGGVFGPSHNILKTVEIFEVVRQ